MTTDPQPARFRWVVLTSYMLTGIVSQLLWITYAPVLSLASSAYGASPSDIGLLSAVYPLVYVVVSIPAGYLIDAFGFRKAVLLGAGFLAVSGLFRSFAPTFALVFALQAVGAVGQPFILNSVSKVVRGWFPESEATLATGLGTLSLFIGLVLGLALTPSLVGVIGLYGTLLVYGAISLAALAVFYALGRESGAAGEARERATLSRVLRVMTTRNIALLSALFFLGLGIFNSVATWIEPMLAARNVAADLAGPLGGLMIVGGIVGSVVIPGLSDRYRTLKRPLMVSLAISTILWSLLGLINGDLPIAVALLVLGFFFVSTLPLALELSARSVEGRAVGIANSVVWEFSQIGGFVMILVYEGISVSSGWGSLFTVSSILTLTCLLLAAFLRAR